ncbi:MAG: TIGR03943 family protein [Nakamurella sp.]
MSKEAQSVVVMLLGGLMVSITVTGRFTAYVRPGFGPLLLIGGIALILLAVVSLIPSFRKDPAPAAPSGDLSGSESMTAPDRLSHNENPASVESQAHGHDHSRSRAPWLMLAPVIVLLVLAPPPLGAESLNRTAQSRASAGGPQRAATPVGADLTRSASAGPSTVPGGSTLPAPGSLTLQEFVLRAVSGFEDQYSVTDAPTTVIGFIAPSIDGSRDRYTIGRMFISCCAADATAVRINVEGQPPFAAGTWVEASITAVRNTATEDNEYVPTVKITSMTEIPQPSEPYEY